MKRLLVIALISGGFAAVSPAGAHECGTVEVRYEAKAVTTTPGISVEMAEIQPMTFCADEGAPVLGELRGTMTVIKDGQLVCHRTDVDPSFDPFGFGAGIHHQADDVGDCALGATWVSLLPNAPMPEESGPQDGGVGVAVGKYVLAEGDIQSEDFPNNIPGLRLRTEDGFEYHAISDENAPVWRKVVVIPEF